jgi:hypothetical protein
MLFAIVAFQCVILCGLALLTRARLPPLLPLLIAAADVAGAIVRNAVDSQMDTTSWDQFDPHRADAILSIVVYTIIAIPFAIAILWLPLPVRRHPR